MIASRASTVISRQFRHRLPLAGAHRHLCHRRRRKITSTALPSALNLADFDLAVLTLTPDDVVGSAGNEGIERFFLSSITPSSTTPPDPAPVPAPLPAAMLLSGLALLPILRRKQGA